MILLRVTNWDGEAALMMTNKALNDTVRDNWSWIYIYVYIHHIRSRAAYSNKLMNDVVKIKKMFANIIHIMKLEVGIAY